MKEWFLFSFSREYKEALKQQRSQEVYKIKEQKSLYDSNDQLQQQLNSAAVCPNSQPSSVNDDMEIRLNGNTQCAIVPKSIMKSSANNTTNGLTNSAATTNCEDVVLIPKKPIQKVIGIPSRNTTELMSTATKNDLSSVTSTNGECIGYVKPSSPMKMINGGSNGGGVVGATTTVSGVGVGILTNNNKFTTSTAGSGISTNNKLVVAGKAHRWV